MMANNTVLKPAVPKTPPKPADKVTEQENLAKVEAEVTADPATKVSAVNLYEVLYRRVSTDIPTTLAVAATTPREAAAMAKSYLVNIDRGLTISEVNLVSRVVVLTGGYPAE